MFQQQHHDTSPVLRVDDALLTLRDEQTLGEAIDEAEVGVWICALGDKTLKAYLRSNLLRLMPANLTPRRLRGLDRSIRRCRSKGGRLIIARKLQRLDVDRGAATRLLLDHPGHRELRRRYRDVEKLRERFIRANIRLVVHMANKIGHRVAMAVDDLVSEGMFGLMKAVDRYEGKRGFRFSTYAAWWIRHCMNRAIQNQSSTVRMPAYRYERNVRAARLRSQTALLDGREPSDAEYRAKKATPSPIRMVSIDAIHAGSGEHQHGVGNTLQNILVSDDPHPDVEDAREHLRVRMLSLLDRLTPTEKKVVVERFYEGRTLSDVGLDLGVCRERVRQVEAVAIEKMKRWVTGEEAISSS